MSTATTFEFEPDKSKVEVGALLTSIFIIAVCSLVYELIIGSLSAYLLGDTVYQFSLTIGFFLSAMGVGSFLSRAVRQHLLPIFLSVEIAIGVIGGFSAAGLFGAFTLAQRSYGVVMVVTIVMLGTLIGLEIPLLTRIAKKYGNLRNTLSNVLAFDYLGALIGSLLFPLFLLPYLGLSKTAFLVGTFNLLVVVINLRVFGRELYGLRRYIIATGLAFALLALGFLESNAITSLFENALYQDEIIYSEQTPYQRLVITTYQDDLRLYLDRELQFSSRDEYRYHESLVHPAMSLAASRESVLIIGGGDGLAVREVLKYPDVQHVTLVDIDAAVTHMGQTFEPVVALNQNSLNDPRVQIINQDGYKFLADSSDLYPVIIADLPDPRSESLARLFSHDFYGLVKRHLARGGMFVTQSSSPYFVRKAYWCIAHTMASTGLSLQTYHTYIPTFGDWGFVIASDLNIDWSRLHIHVPTRYLKDDLLSVMTMFDPDISEVPTDISTLENPAVWQYYLEGWRRWRA